MSASNNFPTLKPSLLLDFTNSQTLDPRASYTCASPQEYFGGEMVLAEQNLVPWSEDFTKWTLNGGLTRSKNSVTADATTAHHRVSNAPSLATVPGMVYTQSWVVEKGGHRYIQLAVNNKPSDYCNFDLEDVVKGTYGGVGSNDAGIIDNGDGTCLVWMRYTAVGGDNDPTLQLTPSASVGRLASWTATGTETLGILRSQFEQREFYTSYTKTEGQPITRYQPKLSVAPAGVPFFPVDPITGEAQGLGIQPQVTNLLTWSNDFSQSSWTKNYVTVTTGQAVGMDGGLSLSTLVSDNGINGSVTNLALANLRTGSIALANGTRYSYIVEAKAKEKSVITIGAIGSSAFGVYPNATFDLSTGTVTSSTGVTARIMPIGNGLYLCGIITNATTSATSVPFGVCVVGTGDGVSGVYIGRQAVIQGDYFDIPPKTEGSQVTRAATMVSMTGSAFSEWYRQDEGSFVVEYSAEKNSGAALMVSDGTANNRTGVIAYSPSSPNQSGGFLEIFVAGASQALLGTNGFIPGARKIAFSYKVDDIKYARSGGTSLADTSAAIPTVDRIHIGTTYASYTMTGVIKKVAYYPKALTAAELEALTK